MLVEWEERDIDDLDDPNMLRSANMYYDYEIYWNSWEHIEYIFKIQQGEVNKFEFSKFSKHILSFFVKERIPWRRNSV